MTYETPQLELIEINPADIVRTDSNNTPDTNLPG